MKDKYNKLAATACRLRTVCEVLREIGDLHQEATAHDEKIRGKLYEAINMAKRMDKALKETHGYKLGPDGWWKPNQDHEQDAAKRKAALKK